MLSKRLEEILSAIDKSTTLIDIGCDHGYVGYNAMERGLCERAIMTDISSPSLEKARKLMDEKYRGKVSFVVSDGVTSVKEPFDFALICGMGGLEIVKILCDERFDKVLIQPMNNLPFVRESLVKMGFQIVFDRIFFDEKFYNLIKLQRGKDSLTELEVDFGRSNLNERGEDFMKYLEKEYAKTEKILKGICEDNKRFLFLKEYLKKIEKIANDY